MLIVAILKAGMGKSDALSGLIKRLILSTIDEESARHFISKIENVLGSRALIHAASPIKP